MSIYVPPITPSREVVASVAPARYAPVGSRVHDGYWGDVYLVIAHVRHDDWRGESVVVRWMTGPLEGATREHSTPFDPDKDTILE